MSMSSELKNLKRQRREEIKSLHLTYLRTKRQVQRVASPGRIVRKHWGVGMGIAALAGFLLAPRPTPRVRYVNHAAAAEPRKQSWWHSLVAMLPPKLAAYIPGVDGEQASKEQKEHYKEEYVAAPPKKGKGALGTLLKAIVPLLTMLIKKLDVQHIIDQVMQQVAGKRQGHEDGHEEGHAPDVSVADVGTVRPTDFEHFD